MFTTLHLEAAPLRQGRGLGGAGQLHAATSRRLAALHCALCSSLAVTGPSWRWHSPSQRASSLSNSAPIFKPQTVQEMYLYAPQLSHPQAPDSQTDPRPHLSPEVSI